MHARTRTHTHTHTHFKQGKKRTHHFVPHRPFHPERAAGAIWEDGHLEVPEKKVESVLPRAVEVVVLEVPDDRVDAVAQGSGSRPSPGSGEVRFQRAGAGVRAADCVRVVGPHVAEHVVQPRVVLHAFAGREHPDFSQLLGQHVARDHRLHHVRAVEAVHAIAPRRPVLPAAHNRRLAPHAANFVVIPAREERGTCAISQDGSTLIRQLPAHWRQRKRTWTPTPAT
ncbi:MAG: hypothetical protein BJ554DRAFT_5982 [Olpidium bornovanus]|uniref:Uncharacterized protein n=1 Tax=Olpidium bornovanus TaxID=278681 RepID=A0A8H7ZYA7_9FUNG|nr:MAG: hypothetical protein BJ554DRAFT_5982 [Olpidium bornovanus]